MCLWEGEYTYIDIPTVQYVQLSVIFICGESACGTPLVYCIKILNHVYYRIEGEGQFTDTEGQVWVGTFRHKAAPGLKFQLKL